jgi:ABC-type glycerol-3-phosphate transport system permease component
VRTVFTEQGDIYTRRLLNTLIYAGLGAGSSTLLAALAGFMVITAAMVCVILLIVLFPSLQRFWRTGMVAGSVK